MTSSPSKSRSEQVRNWYKAHPEAYKKSGRHRPGYENEQYAKKRLALIKLLGGECSECGNGDYRVLQLNHLNGQGREDARSYGTNYDLYKAILKRKRTTEDLNLLCGNCNILYEYKTGRRKAVHSLRLKAVQALGGKCVACGNSDPRVLHINHVNGREEKYQAGKKQFDFYRAIGDGKGDEGVDLRCANCNILYEYEMHRRRELK